METFSALLALCAGNSPVPGELPAQRPVTRSFDVVFDLRPNKWLSKQWWDRWFETPSRPLWRHRNDFATQGLYDITYIPIYANLRHVGMYYYVDMTQSQAFQPMEAQLSV